MTARVLVKRVASLALVSAMLWCSGCAYMHTRGTDAQDIFEAGISVSKKPGVALYVGLFNAVPLGVSKVEGTLFGIGHRQSGAIAMRQDAVGLLVWGREQFGYHDFDASNPDSPQPWNVGVLGLTTGAKPPKHEVMNFAKQLHVGWIGITLNGHFLEFLDFLTGWAGADIMGDDTAPPGS